MFNLIYRDGAPENTGHYEAVETAADLKLGQAVELKSGKAVLATGDVKVYGIVTEPTHAGVVGVLKVMPDMIFKCPVSAAPTSLLKGGKVTINAGNGVTATAASTAGATVVDKLDAVAEGDMIEVCFE